MTALDHPQETQIEVSVFSRGYGECICIHVGRGRWVIIDSLKDKDGVPVAASYLEKIGVKVEHVSAMLFTHWHDDHIAGAANLVSEYDKAIVAISGVLRTDEFRAFLRRTPSVQVGKTSSGVDELYRIVQIMRDRNKAPHFCFANRRVIEEFDCGLAFESLSPCDADYEQMLQRLNQLVTPEGVARRFPMPSRNDVSVASALHIGDRLFLFGADLEVSGAHSGWHAVHASAWRNRGKADFYKIAHHGSLTGEFQPIWDDLLEPGVMAVLTPWSRGSKLPRVEDVERILGKTRNAFAASRVTRRKSDLPTAAVQRSLREANISIYRQPREVGHIRFRSSHANEWSVDFLAGDSCHLKDLLQ